MASDWHGGVVGGSIVRGAATAPWSVVFKDGSKVTRRVFPTQEAALEWRKQHSDATGKTTNRWRALDARTVEVNVDGVVHFLCDRSYWRSLAKYVWSVRGRGHCVRVATTGSYKSSTHGLNKVKKPTRNLPKRTLVTLPQFIRADLDQPIPMRSTGRQNVLDFRRDNLRSRGEFMKYRATLKREGKSEKEVPLPEPEGKPVTYLNISQVIRVREARKQERKKRGGKS